MGILPIGDGFFFGAFFSRPQTSLTSQPFHLEAEKMKLSVKIAVSMGALATLMAVLGIYLIMQMSKVNDVSTGLSQRQMPLVEQMGVINNAASEYRLAEVLHIYATDPVQMREYEKQQQKWMKVIADGVQKLSLIHI